MLLELTIDYFDNIYIVTETVKNGKYTYEPIDIINNCHVNGVNIVTYKTNKRKKSTKYLNINALYSYSVALKRHSDIDYEAWL